MMVMVMVMMLVVVVPGGIMNLTTTVLPMYRH